LQKTPLHWSKPYLTLQNGFVFLTLLEHINTNNLTFTRALNPFFSNFDFNNYFNHSSYQALLSPLRTFDYIYLFFQSALFWSPPKTGIWLQDNIHDSTLALHLETLPRTLAFKSVTVANEKKLTKTKSGLYLLPNISQKEIPLLTHFFYEKDHTPSESFLTQLNKEYTEIQVIDPELTLMDSLKNKFIFTEEYINTPSVKILSHYFGVPFNSQNNNFPWIFLLRLGGLMVIFISLGKFYQNKFFSK